MTAGELVRRHGATAAVIGTFLVLGIIGVLLGTSRHDETPFEAGPVLFSSTFGGPMGGPLPAVGPNPWSALAGTWNVGNGTAWLASADPTGPEVRLGIAGNPQSSEVLGSVALTIVDPPAEAGSVGVTTMTTALNCGLAVRVRDVDHFWAIVPVPNVATWNILKIRDGRAKLVANTGLSGAGQRSRVVASLGRESFVVNVNGAMTTIRDSYLAGERATGLVAFSPGCEAARWENFVVAR